MFPTDFTETGFLYQERLRAAENRRTYNRLVKSAEAYRRAHGQESVGLLSSIAQWLHLKARPQVEANDSRHAHAV